MRIHLLSDLHLEFAPIHLPGVEADVVVLAGDIDLGDEGIQWAALAFADRPVIYVPGNHEYYHQSVPDAMVRMRATAKRLGIRLLDGDSVTIDGVRFLGCTLWTDFRATNDVQGAIELAKRSAMDYKMIRIAPSYRYLEPNDTINWHVQAISWLRNQTADTSVPTVVITHHAPSMKSNSPTQNASPLRAAFTSDLDAFVVGSRIPLWIHGHTHHCVDYYLDRTRIVSNQRGYPDEPLSGFDPAFVIDFDPLVS